MPIPADFFCLLLASIRVLHLSAAAGVLSDELQGALGMSDASPPPWLINMQR